MLIRDALVNREIARIRVFTDWCQKWQVRGFLGELGWNQNDHDIDLWNDLARTVFETCFDPAGCHVALFAASGSGTPNGYLYMYQGNGNGTINSRRGGAGVTEWSATARPPLMRGTNVIGGEFAAGGVSPTSTYSNLNPGTYGAGSYQYQDAASASYLAGRGLSLARVSFKWERLQPTLGAAFDATEVTRLSAFLDQARLVGLRCVLDVHNYAGYYKDVAGTGTRFSINDGTLTTAHFTDLWTRLSTLFKAHAGVWAYGLMNEPTHMTLGSSPSFASEQAHWEYQCQQAVAAIRANGDSKLIMVPGYNWSSAQTWTQYHSAPWVSDANVAYEAHHYFDTNTSGAQVLYVDELAIARAAGYTDPVRARQAVTGLRSSVDARAEVGVIAEGG